MFPQEMARKGETLRQQCLTNNVRLVFGGLKNWCISLNSLTNFAGDNL